MRTICRTCQHGPQDARASVSEVEPEGHTEDEEILRVRYRITCFNCAFSSLLASRKLEELQRTVEKLRDKSLLQRSLWYDDISLQIKKAYEEMNRVVQALGVGGSTILIGNCG